MTAPSRYRKQHAAVTVTRSRTCSCSRRIMHWRMRSPFLHEMQSLHDLLACGDADMPARSVMATINWGVFDISLSRASACLMTSLSGIRRADSTASSSVELTAILLSTCNCGDSLVHSENYTSGWAYHAINSAWYTLHNSSSLSRYSVP